MMRARTSRRAAEREARRRDKRAPFERSARLVEETIRRFGPPPDPDRIVLVSDGSNIWIHEYSALCAALRAEGNADAAHCATSLEAMKLCPGAVRVVLRAADGGWQTGRAMTFTAPGGDA